MPARDTYHQHVVDALVRDGWRITHDPLTIRIGTKDVFIDLGAEHILAAEKAGRAMVLENGRLRLMVFDPDRREVLQWIP